MPAPLAGIKHVTKSDVTINIPTKTEVLSQC